MSSPDYLNQPDVRGLEPELQEDLFQTACHVIENGHVLVVRNVQRVANTGQPVIVPVIVSGMVGGDNAHIDFHLPYAVDRSMNALVTTGHPVYHRGMIEVRQYNDRRLHGVFFPEDGRQSRTSRYRWLSLQLSERILAKGLLYRTIDPVLKRR